MKGFGITLLILCVLSGAISVFAIFAGNQTDTANGIVFFGSALGGMLMSCILITLADIRDAVRTTAANSEARMSAGTLL